MVSFVASKGWLDELVRAIPVPGLAGRNRPGNGLAKQGKGKLLSTNPHRLTGTRQPAPCRQAPMGHS
jgi:hypothetical protein